MLLSSIPVGSQLGVSVGHQAARFALENQDFQHAELIARKAVQAKPDDFQERVWLAYILLASGKVDEAEQELREAIALSPGDSDRWDTLVTFMIFTKQSAKADKVIQEAATKLTSSKAPLTLALCCEKMGRAYEGTGNDVELKKWNDAAKKWYGEAQKAQPDDLSIKRRLAEYFLRSRQIDEAEKCLNEIRQQGGGARNAETAAWANRTLALGTGQPRRSSAV